MYSTSLTGDRRILAFHFGVVYHASPRGADIVFRLRLEKGLNARQACRLFRSVRDTRRRRLAGLLIRDLDITMKTDKSRLLPPVQSLQGCLNSRPGSHQPLKTNVFRRGSISQPRSIRYPQSINDVIRLQNRTNGCSGAGGGGDNVGLRGREYTGWTCAKSF